PDAQVRHLSLVRERVREITVGLEVARVHPPAVAYRIVCRIGKVIKRRRQSEASPRPPNSPRAQPQPRLVAIAPLDPELGCLSNGSAEKQGEEDRGPRELRGARGRRWAGWAAPSLAWAWRRPRSTCPRPFWARRRRAARRRSSSRG